MWDARCAHFDAGLYGWMPLTCSVAAAAAALSLMSACRLKAEKGGFLTNDIKWNFSKVRL